MLHRRIKTFSSLLALTCITITTDCRAEKYSKLNYANASTTEEVKLPTLGDIADAEIGETMIASYNRTTSPGLKLKKPISGVVKALWAKFNIKLGTDIIPLAHTKDGASFYIDLNGVVPELAGMRPALRIPKEGTDVFEICYNQGEFYNCDPTPKLVEGDDFDYAPYVTISSNAFRRELVYTGGNKNSITLLYREYMNDMAKPAFSQELKYEISEDPVIGFKGARFQVIKADNTSLKFKMIKHLN